MTCRLVCCLLFSLIATFALQAQATSQPFASLERAVKGEPAGWAGDKSKLSLVFDAERRTTRR